MKTCIQTAKSAMDEITTVANDKPYNNTKTEDRLPLYHERKIIVNIPINEMLSE